jgi:AcrR family transcriptional regulator
MHPASAKVKKRASFDDLLVAGLQAIATKGIDHVNVMDLTNYSGVSRPTFYTYFGDMHGLFAEVWLHYGREWLDAQLDPSIEVSPEEDQALLEIFAAARRIPELLEVVQPEAQRWWEEKFGDDLAAKQNASWYLGAQIGRKISKEVSGKGILAEQLYPLINVTNEELASPLMAGLGNPDKLPVPMSGIQFNDSSIEDSLTHAAVEVVAKSGVFAASMTRIARRARVSTGSVYPRFKNSESLIQSSFQKAIRDIVSGNVSVIEAGGPGVDQYGQAVNTGFGQERESWRNYRIEMHLAAAHDPTLASFMEPGFEETATLLRDSAVRMGVSVEQATVLAWFMHVHAIGVSILFNAIPEIGQLDYRVMARHLGNLLRPSAPLP